ncbi:hypothetical protein EV421DRAFT_1911250 [Armillaria borealis]|uniref:Uncharacterized protein n=1 Tax=Armillaria borealis TaxID=47425 RepID=A0AA39IYA9_9AGAR|nr:hypothetical protein EV421DRAFT_1911250 [Armillaria borealis]
MFHPPSTFETFREGMDHRVSAFVSVSLEDSMTSFVTSCLGLDPSAITFKIGFVGEVASHVFILQTHGGVPFPNVVGNVAMKNNKIMPFGSSFVSLASIASWTPSVALEDAIASTELTLPGSFNQFPLLSGT